MIELKKGSVCYMKLVSPKALLASLLGILFVIAKAMTFDGILDLLWMVAFGYFTIKGLTIAFSQKAYDEDMKEAYLQKVLYRDLFGKFAYIAADIPIIAILLASLLASVFPVTAILRIGPVCSHNICSRVCNLMTDIFSRIWSAWDRIYPN